MKFPFQFDFFILRYKRKWRLDGDGHGDATAELYCGTALAWNIYTPDRGKGQGISVVNGLFTGAIAAVELRVVYLLQLEVEFLYWIWIRGHSQHAKSTVAEFPSTN